MKKYFFMPMGVFDTVQVNLIMFKLFGLIDWNWILVFAPFLILTIFALNAQNQGDTK